MSASQLKQPPVPKQEKGAMSDTSHSVKLKTSKEAEDFFKVVKKRLLNVSEWHKLCGLVSATFVLTDSLGNKVKRLVKEGDYLRIDIPGPGSKAGHGYDWVRIEAIENKNSPVDDYEEVYMRARPAENPKGNTKKIAHFLQDDASSTFMVTREKNIVKAEVHGRNELPNVREQAVLLDKIRNTFIAISAMLGFSKSQWKKLAKGLLSREKQT